ncbi:hypothetical protein, partial [Rhodoferax sp.]|uniref:hypothetical protein n=1 Tax=Rhodoferax sp. TaxID=50421 RepID=UPI0025D30384
LAMSSPVIATVAVIANEVTQSMTPEVMDRHASLAMTKSLFKVRVRYRVGYGGLAVTKRVFKAGVRFRVCLGAARARLALLHCCA